MLDVILAVLVLVGAFFTLVGSWGLAKMPDFFMRLHGPTKATTIGVGAVLLASSLYFSFHTGEVSLHEVLITLFLFMTAPVSAHIMAKAALHLQVKQVERTGQAVKADWPKPKAILKGSRLDIHPIATPCRLFW